MHNLIDFIYVGLGSAILIGIPFGYWLGHRDSKSERKRLLDYAYLSFHGWRQTTCPELIKERILQSTWIRNGGKESLILPDAVEAQKRIDKHKALDLPQEIPTEARQLKAGMWK